MTLLRQGAVALLLCSTATLAQPFFTDVTESIAPDLERTRGVAVGDVNHDGWPDLVVPTWNTSSSAITGRLQLLGNVGGRFEDWTAAVGFSRHTRDDVGSGSTFADFDGDGDVDLFVPIGGWGQRPLTADLLLRNDRGVFVNVAADVGLDQRVKTDNAIWLDYDRDGDVDLYRGPQRGETSSRGNELLRNDAGHFVDISSDVGMDESLQACCGGTNGGMVATDVDRDGHHDLYLGSWNSPNRLFRADGEGGYADATTAEVGDAGEAHGVAVGDINNDGWIDVFQTAGNDRAQSRSILLFNNQGQLLDVTAAAGLGEVGSVKGAGFADIDNDGDLDLLTGNIHHLFLNQGDGRFIDHTDESGIRLVSVTLSFVDFDLDGCLDVVFGHSQTRSSFQDGRLPARIYRNNCNDNHWLTVELAGTQSATDGIGARITAISGTLRQTREVFGGLGHGNDERAAHFGLADHARVDTLRIDWPSGATDVVSDLPVDRRVRVVEGSNFAHDVRPMTWSHDLPDTLWVGQTASASLTVWPSPFDATSQVAEATLSNDVNGAHEAFVDRADGSFELAEHRFVATSNGLMRIQATVDQETSVGARWGALSHTVTMLPAGDLVIADEGLADRWGWSLIEVDLIETNDDVYVGQSAVRITGRSESAFTLWTAEARPENPPSTVGYRAVQFAIRPGVFSEDRRNQLWLTVNGDPTVFSRGIDLTLKEWQVVEVPIDPRMSQIDSISIQGNMSGVFFIDDLRLVATHRAPPITAVTERLDPTTPTTFALSQNYPNPFNPATTIRFDLPEAGDVELAVFNLAGQRVAELASGFRETGSYTLRWDGTDDAGRALASGVYFYRLVSGERVQSRKLLLLR